MTILIAAFFRFCFAAEPFELKYPELTVTPLASKRIEMESFKEKQASWGRYWPILVSALATLYAANDLKSLNYENASQSKLNDRDSAVTAGQWVGGAWLIGTIIMEFQYRPYDGALTEWNFNNKVPVSTADALTRERMAEEVLFRAESLAKTIKWSSFISQALASAYMQSAYSGEKTKFSAPLAILVSGLPLLFPNRYELAGRYQKSYKTRIYSQNEYLPKVQAWVQQDAQKKYFVVQNFSWVF